MSYRKAVVRPPVTVGETYDEGDVVGGLMKFDIGENKPSGYISQITIIDRHDNKLTPFHVFWFDDEPMSIANHALFLPTALDMEYLICMTPVATDDYEFAGERSYVRKAIINGQGSDFELSDSYIWAYAVCLGNTPTYETTECLTFKLGVQLET